MTFAEKYKAKQAELDKARDELAAQWAKYDSAVERGLTGAPLVQIDRKLKSLQQRVDLLYDDLRNPRAGWRGF